MKIAIVGASGYVGRAILDEALARGHEVTAIVRDAAKLAHAERLKSLALDVTDIVRAQEAFAHHDAIISAFSGHSHQDVMARYVTGIRAIIEATRRAQVSRLLVVGGAGSLQVKPGLELLDTPDFPEQWRATAEGARKALRILLTEQELSWTMLSPSAHLEPGAKRGKYRIGLNDLLVDENGASHIGLGDFADAMLNELEQPQHIRQRFTVGY